MKITYTLWQGTRIIGNGLVAYKVEEINEMLDELKKLDNLIEPHATILRVENGDN